jgi:hypothetical protein
MYLYIYICGSSEKFFEVQVFSFYFFSLLMDTMLRVNHYMKRLAVKQNRNPLGLFSKQLQGSSQESDASFRQIRPTFVSFLSSLQEGS